MPHMIKQQLPLQTPFAGSGGFPPGRKGRCIFFATLRTVRVGKHPSRLGKKLNRV